MRGRFDSGKPVAEETAPATTSTLDVSGFNGDDLGKLLITCRGRCVADGIVGIQLNGVDAADQYKGTYVRDTGVTRAAATQSSNIFFAIPTLTAGLEFTFAVFIPVANSGFYRGLNVAQMVGGYDSDTGTVLEEKWELSSVWLNKVDPITSVRVVSLGTFDDSTIVRVYR